MGKDKIKSLLERVRELERSEKNQLRKEKWSCLPYTARDQILI
ncbi:MAG: hypothetical protein PWP27_551 [Clostridiales bacterium]|jgi:hypothetical protein|nr:hypothetical protein [Clostridiales bacterium]MDK2932741.1 hypothetical protein [Clostridiales bacterium]